MPVRVIITSGTTADCTVAPELIEGTDAEYLLADKGYDSNKIVELACYNDTEPVIPPRKGRKEERPDDKQLYKYRHLAENTFLRFKEWRGIVTRYDKRVDSYLASVQIRCIFCWLKIF